VTNGINIWLTTNQ